MHVVAIVADIDRAAANAVLEAAGHGPDNFAVGLSADGGEPATHWAFQHNDVSMIVPGLPDSVSVTTAENGNGLLAAATASLGLQIVQPEGI